MLVFCIGHPLRFRSYLAFLSTARICICRLAFLGWGIACRTFEIVVSHPLHKSIACPYPKEVELVYIQKKASGIVLVLANIYFGVLQIIRTHIVDSIL